MRRPVRHPNIYLGLTIAALTGSVVLAVIHGQIVAAVIAGVIWTFYVVIVLASLVVWLRRRPNGSASEPRADRAKT